MQIRDVSYQDALRLDTALKEKPSLGKKVTIGFDGYIDSLYRVVKSRNEGGSPQFYNTIEEYGSRIMRAANQSADIELVLRQRTYGGNAPVMAAALARLGVSVRLLGALGYPEVDECFAPLLSLCGATSYAQPCSTIALEFDDGKIMMGDLQNSVDISLERILRAVPPDTLRSYIEQSDLVCLVNWSAHDGMEAIVRHVVSMLIASQNPEKLCFFDLSDPSARSEGAIRAFFDEIALLGPYARTVLGMNVNEAQTVFRCMGIANGDISSIAEMAECARALFTSLGLYAMNIHATQYALGLDAHGVYHSVGFHVAEPKISTGGGDHFNAGFCLGLLNDYDIPQSLLCGNAASSFFVENGIDADTTVIREQIRNCHNKTEE